MRAGSQHSGRAEDRQTANRAPLASSWVPGLLALEIGTVGRAPEHLIHKISTANPLWGAPRIHGELLKLGIDVRQTTVAKYMAKTRGLPSQGLKIFLVNHADGITSMDLFVVPTISLRLLHGIL
jgi:hypothetical protein